MKSKFVTKFLQKTEPYPRKTSKSLKLSQVYGRGETGLFLEDAQGFQGSRTEGVIENIFYPCENRKSCKYSEKQEIQEMQKMALIPFSEY